MISAPERRRSLGMRRNQLHRLLQIPGDLVQGGTPSHDRNLEALGGVRAPRAEHDELVAEEVPQDGGDGSNSGAMLPRWFRRYRCVGFLYRLADSPALHLKKGPRSLAAQELRLSHRAAARESGTRPRHL